MATKKAAGSAKNLRDSNPKYLGVKLTDGQKVKPGMVIIRQRGTKFLAGDNVAVGKDHTLFALKEGIVTFTNRRKIGFNDKISYRKSVSVK